jgi:Domain of unknown function (DUF4407)
MKNYWLRFGCFLTGINYQIIRNSSEVSAKTVKRYTSAMLIVCSLWAFIGFFFTQRYLRGGVLGSIAGSAVFIFLIVQIERQIILSGSSSKWLYLVRGGIALTMAVLGAVIIDQIIFKDDIELEKVTFIQARIDSALPPKTAELRAQIASLETAMQNKENEKQTLNNDINQHPSIRVYSTILVTKTEKSVSTDSTGKNVTTEKSLPTQTTVSSSAPNPNIARVAPLETVIDKLRQQKNERELALLNIRPQLEKEMSSKVGFLDELKIMMHIISGSKEAMVVWLIWFVFLLFLETLVLVGKATEQENDYERTVKHHMELQNRRLGLIFDKLSAETNN